MNCNKPLMEVVAETANDIQYLPTDWRPGSKCHVKEDHSTWSFGWHKDYSNIVSTIVNEVKAQANEYLEQLFEDTDTLQVKFLLSLPTGNDIKEKTLYFVPKSKFKGDNNNFYCYIWIDSHWESICGEDNPLVMTQYVTKEYLEQFLKSSPQSGQNDFIDGDTLVRNEDGQISISSYRVNELINEITDDKLNSLFSETES